VTVKCAIVKIAQTTIVNVIHVIAQIAIVANIKKKLSNFASFF